MAKFVPSDDPNKADASPTKRFFVDIITRDIQLDEAIQDLVDNCVDGAKRLRPKGDYRGLKVEIEVTPNHFVISDNCGGIPLETARKYAFKFGRAAGFEETDHSVGQFGIGMKRALFKMGAYFEVSSTEPAAKFKIDVDIPLWLADEGNWDFPITDLEERKFQEAETGTTLRVTRLNVGVPERFGQDTFKSILSNNIRIAHAQPMAAGLEISFNGSAIIASVWQLKSSDSIQPVVKSYPDDLGGKALLTTRLHAGVAESSRQHAGWYIFCNGRCILEADQSKTTGWSEVDEGVAIPKYHNQFARFRGYAFLDSDDASLLPWNTTKTGLDEESPAYRRLKPRLIEAMRPIISFLNALDSEQDLEPADRVLTSAVASAPAVPLARLPERAAFVFQAPAKRGPPMSRIAYKKPKAEADKLLAAFNVKKLPDLGERSFEFAYENLVEDD
ncbi:ATP-binding protein [Sphingomonas sp. Root241]|uniref:ATP-binding protein n=1 Tax=Sphingomonas sp. Root241 TaxID=1736501 RepID=UPI000B0F6400|nr:ATP-binding protein [Sphingomonas sp. Root241]